MGITAIGLRGRTIAALVLTLAAWSFATAGAQPPAPAAPLSTAEVVRSVEANPAGAPQATAQAVAAGRSEDAAPLVAAVVGILQPADRRALAPSVVTSAIAALAVPDRTPFAPAVACAAVRAVPAPEQPGVVPAIVSAAVALAPLARPQIVACAIAAAPALVAAINDAAGGALAAQLEAASSPPTPLPGNSIGLDSTLELIGRFGDFFLWITDFNGLDHASHGIQLVEVIESAFFHVERLALDEVGAAERVDSLGYAGFERNDLLSAQCDARGFLGR